jgi:hypothetical protein
MLLRANESGKSLSTISIRIPRNNPHSSSRSLSRIFERIPPFFYSQNVIPAVKNLRISFNTASFLVQQADVPSTSIVTTRAFFFFQGEPAWKVFLQQEISDLSWQKNTADPC